VGSQALGFRRDGVEVRLQRVRIADLHTGPLLRRTGLQAVPALVNGLYNDWELVEDLWTHALRRACAEWLLEA